MRNDEVVWEMFSEFTNVRKLAIKLQQGIGSSNNLKDFLKSLRLRRFSLENFDDMLNANEAPRWFFEIFGAKEDDQSSNKLKVLNLGTDYSLFPEFLANPILSDLVEQLRKVYVSFDIENLKNAAAFERIFHLISRRNKESEIRIVTESWHLYIPKLNAGRFFEFLFGISDQRPTATSRENLVKISFEIDSHEDIQDSLEQIRNLRNSGIEIVWKPEISRQAPLRDQNQVQILYSSNLLVAIRQDILQCENFERVF